MGLLSDLPGWAHVPGETPGPDRAWLDAAKARLEMAALIETGRSLLFQGYFWEAHELLEKGWMVQAPNSAEREMLRALIQIANGLLKLRMGKAQAARRLLVEARTILSGIMPARDLFGFNRRDLEWRLAAALEVHRDEFASVPGIERLLFAPMHKNA